MTALVLNKEAFIKHVAYLKAKILIYPVWKAQIALFFVKKIIISTKYANFSDVFFKEFITVFSKHLNINKRAINLKLNKKPPYRLIYNLCLI